MARIYDNESLDLGDLNEESSIESSFCSDHEPQEVDDDDLDSDTEHHKIVTRSSHRGTAAAETESTESPLLSADDSDMDLSESLNDDEIYHINDDDDDGQCALNSSGLISCYHGLNGVLSLFPPMTSSTPLAKITEHTREYSTSCHTTAIQAEEALSQRLSSPSARFKRRYTSTKSPRKSPRHSERGTLEEGDEDRIPISNARVIVFEEGIDLATKLSSLARKFNELDLPDPSEIKEVPN